MSSDSFGPQLRLSEADLPTLVAAWEGTVRAFLALAESIPDEQWSLQTRCQGWTVGDMVAHVAAVESELSGLPQPEVNGEVTTLSHVGDNPFSQWTERGVSARRDRSRDEVLEELASVIDLRAAQLEVADLAEGSIDVGPGGVDRPLDVTLRMRLFDIWVHDQDLRAVIGRPGELGSAGAHATAHTLVSALPFVLGKKAGALPGQSVRLIVTGAVAFDRTVEVGPDGKARFVPVGTAGATATVTMEWPAFVILGCGRGEAESQVTGDEELGVAFVRSLNIAP